ncbi:MAG: hypothetical protein AB7N76_33395 [Planctomycetota bacterium]
MLRELGRGGMGVVYEVEHEGLGRRYALKRMYAGADPEERARFEREVQAQLRLDHPGLVRVEDADGRLCSLRGDQAAAAAQLLRLSERAPLRRALGASSSRSASGTLPSTRADGSRARRGRLWQDRAPWNRRASTRRWRATSTARAPSRGTPCSPPWARRARGARWARTWRWP